VELKATYIGGPTAVFEWRGVRFVTDPTFDQPGEYQSGPSILKKTTGPAVAPESIGHVDLVLLSHDHHWDNFDHAGRTFSTERADHTITTSEGAKRVGGNSVGLGVWETYELKRDRGPNLVVTATPARHGPAHSDRGPVIGFVLTFADAPAEAVYFGGDTVWYESVEEVARRFEVKMAILNLGAASVPQVGPFHLTMTAEEAVLAARAFPNARIVPLHYEGWEHFQQHRPEIDGAFNAAGMHDRLSWLDAGKTVVISNG